jgi:hypothetical protein
MALQHEVRKNRLVHLYDFTTGRYDCMAAVDLEKVGLQLEDRPAEDQIYVVVCSLRGSARYHVFCQKTWERLREQHMCGF